MGLQKTESTSKAGSLSDDRQHYATGDISVGTTGNANQELHRKLGNRQIQLIAIGGSIGTALFVSIGGGLHTGGPGSLFIAYALYSCLLALVNNCMAEMTCFMPVSGGFIRLAGEWVDDALGFMAGWNFFFMEALLIPFEITALALVLSFWRDDIPIWAVCIGCIAAYALLNVLAVKAYGEAEFWLSGGKVILILSLFCFTFITMVGGNPQKDAYGFRYWYDPGSFAEYRSTGTTGRWEGFLSALWSASFTIVGPEYISMVAAEAKRPRAYIKQAFKTVYFRFGLFFIGGALAVGIVVRSNDKTLSAILDGTSEGGGTAAASPYVIAMSNMGIGVYPHIVNALMVTSIFSAGNTYTYVASRNLHGLAVGGRAPKFLSKTTKNGVPIYAFAVVMIFPFLSFLQVSSGTAKVIEWLVALITASALINFDVMAITYIFFYRALKAQGIDRNTLPYKGYFQPYGAYIAVVVESAILLFFGYGSLYPWDIGGFFSNYAVLMAMPVLFLVWKVVHRTKVIKPQEADLVWARPYIDAYEESFITPPIGFWADMGRMIGIGRGRPADQQKVEA